MPNTNGNRSTITDSTGSRKQVRTENRGKAIALIAGGATQKQVSSELCCGRQQIHKWLQEPEFKKRVEESRQIIAFDAVSATAGLIGLATETLLKALQDKIGMESKAGPESGGITVHINLSGNGKEEQTIINVEAEPSSDSDIVDNGLDKSTG